MVTLKLTVFCPAVLAGKSIPLKYKLSSFFPIRRRDTGISQLFLKVVKDWLEFFYKRNRCSLMATKIVCNQPKAKLIIIADLALTQKGNKHTFLGPS